MGFVERRTDTVTVAAGSTPGGTNAQVLKDLDAQAADTLLAQIEASADGAALDVRALGRMTPNGTRTPIEGTNATLDVSSEGTIRRCDVGGLPRTAFEIANSGAADVRLTITLGTVEGR